VAAAFVVAAVGGCSSDDAGNRAQRAEARPPSPLAGQPLYVDPGGPAAVQAAQWRSEGRSDDAAALQLLAARPTAVWLADDHRVASRVRSLTQRAARAGATPVLVAYHIPGRDCGRYSAGGAASANAYRGWIRAFARGIGRHRAAVILEPDAIAQAASGCLSASARADRLALLRFAVDALTARPRATVYLDAGNAGWVRPSRIAGLLGAAGVSRADGFALNVSNFYRTAPTVRYGRALSRRLGGAHFVVDTSRNGNGPSSARGDRRWCNPPGRALGRDPTTNTGSGLVDAYLWVKEPGVSDGSCRSGAPPAGQWWPEYALQLIRNRRPTRP
jgi:endoglucanase